MENSDQYKQHHFGTLSSALKDTAHPPTAAPAPAEQSSSVFLRICLPRAFAPDSRTAGQPGSLRPAAHRFPSPPSDTRCGCPRFVTPLTHCWETWAVPPLAAGSTAAASTSAGAVCGRVRRPPSGSPPEGPPSASSRQPARRRLGRFPQGFHFRFPND